MSPTGQRRGNSAVPVGSSWVPIGNNHGQRKFLCAGKLSNHEPKESHAWQIILARDISPNRACGLLHSFTSIGRWARRADLRSVRILPILGPGNLRRADKCRPPRLQIQIRGHGSLDGPPQPRLTSLSHSLSHCCLLQRPFHHEGGPVDCPDSRRRGAKVHARERPNGPEHQHLSRTAHCCPVYCAYVG